MNRSKIRPQWPPHAPCGCPPRASHKPTTPQKTDACKAWTSHPPAAACAVRGWCPCSCGGCQTKSRSRLGACCVSRWWQWCRVLGRETNRHCPRRKLHDEELTKIENRLNHRPRKRLGFKTPHEVFHASLNPVAVRSWTHRVKQRWWFFNEHGIHRKSDESHGISSSVVGVWSEPSKNCQCTLYVACVTQTYCLYSQDACSPVKPRQAADLPVISTTNDSSSDFKMGESQSRTCVGVMSVSTIHVESKQCQ